MARKPSPAAQTAAIYARYSSSAQNDASIEQQLTECRRYAEDNNLTIVAAYEDRAISGRTDKRPGFQKMLRAAERGEFEVLLAYKSNRIARNMQSALTYEKRLNDAGVRIVYCKEAFDDNATGRFMLRMMMNMNQFYSENMSEDIKRGMHDSASKGLIVGKIPLGYRRSEDNRYQIDEAEAALVREIFRRYLRDEPLADICRDLNARGLKTKLGKPFTRNSFHHILTNEKYTGSYTFGDIRLTDAIPAIIEKGVYQMAQRKLQDEKVVRKRHRGNNDYLLTGKLFCGHCLAPMVGMSARSHTGALHYYYACQTRRTKRACDKQNVRKDFIEEEIVRAVQTTILDDDTTVWIADTLLATAKQFREQSSLAEYESQLRDVKKQIANIVRAIEMGVAGDEVKARMDELQEEKRTLQSLIAVEKIAVKDYDRDTVLGYLGEIRRGDPSDKAFQRMVIRDFIRAVYLYDDHFKLVVDFAGRGNPYTLPLKPDPAAEADITDITNRFAERLVRGTTSALGEPLQRCSIRYTPQGFVITWYFNRAK